jgi:hypothetical protein
MREIKIGGVVKASIRDASADDAPPTPVPNQDNLRRHWSEQCCNFIDYWAGLRGKSKFPTFKQYSETMSGGLTPCTYVVELVDEEAIVRFQGTELVKRWQVDHTGDDIHAGFPQNAKTQSLRNMRDVATHPCGLLWRSIYLTPKKRSVVSDCVLLPLAVEEGCLPRIVQYSAKVGNDPYADDDTEFLSALEFDWLDIGFGVPTSPPLSIDIKRSVAG